VCPRTTGSGVPRKVAQGPEAAKPLTPGLRTRQRTPGPAPRSPAAPRDSRRSRGVYTSRTSTAGTASTNERGPSPSRGRGRNPTWVAARRPRALAPAGLASASRRAEPGSSEGAWARGCSSGGAASSVSVGRGGSARGSSSGGASCVNWTGGS
jgi:hypothetical protein